jgi:hypothetical protein
MRMSKTAVLLAAVVLAYLSLTASAFFDKIGGGSCGGGGGGSCGGGCGGAAAAEEDEVSAPAEMYAPSNVIFAFTGKSHTGKSFVASRFGALLSQQAAWNVTTVPLSFSDFIVGKFAAENGLDAARLKTDLDYRDEHFAKYNRYARELRAAQPMWQFDALDWALAAIAERAVKEPGQRRAFVFDDVQYRFQLRALELLATANARAEAASDAAAAIAAAPTTPVPNAELVTVRLSASDEARMGRGWRSGRVPPSAETDFDLLPASYWGKSFENSGAGEDVVAVDNFLAQSLLRAIAK